ncbi:hypothetical protein [Chitinophaga sp. YIM B06452]|uniref:hypothetical protein n=1 Tax=Chitinophaga sp. YIM B06452 TaxID=3082158 RepID=UPI0031FEC3A8
MDINFTIFATGEEIEDNYLIYQAAETTALGTVVAQRVDPPTQTFPKPVFIAGLNPVVHQVSIFSSTDGVTLGALLTRFNYNPAWKVVHVRPRLQLTVGGPGPHDPAAGQKTFAPIDGSSSVEEIGSWSWRPHLRSRYGYLADSEFTINSANTAFTLTTFNFNSPDYVFIEFLPKVIEANPVFNIPDRFTGYKKVTGTAGVATADATWFHKYVDLVFPTTHGLVNLQASAAVPDNKSLTMFTMNGNQVNTTVRLTGGEWVNWQGLQLTEIYLGRGQYLELIKVTDEDTEEAIYHVVSPLITMQRVGTFVDAETGILETSIIQNLMPCDGGPMLKTDYPALLWYLNRLPAGQVKTKDQRDAAAGVLDAYWAMDDNNIYRPDYKGLHDRVIPGSKGNDSQRNGTSQAGSLGVDVVKDHRHNIFSVNIIEDSNFPQQPSLLDKIVRYWRKLIGGGEGYFMGKDQAGAEPTVGVTSKRLLSDDAQLPEAIENTVKTYGKVRLVWVG